VRSSLIAKIKKQPSLAAFFRIGALVTDRENPVIPGRASHEKQTSPHGRR